MQSRPGLLTGLLVTVALVTVACGGNDDGPEAAAPDAAAEEAAAEPSVAEQAVEAEPALDEPLEAEPEVVEPAEPVEDPDRELLAYGESFEASIDEVEGVRQFRFEGLTGDLVRISVDGKAGMDPTVSLLEPNRTAIAFNDDVSTANRDSLLIARLVSDGAQVVRVGAFGSDIGRFVITIERLPDDPDDDSAVIAIGDTVEGTLGDPFDVDVFEFRGEAGQRVLITVDGALGVDTLAQIFDPDSIFLLVADDTGHGLDAELDLVLLQDGVYRVEVTSVNSKIGPYQLSVKTRVDPPEPDADAVAAMEAVALTYLVALQEADSVTLFALAGPEALALWGWESPEEVSRDTTKLQSIGVAGQPGEITSTLSGVHGRTTIELADAGASLRFDVIKVDGQWKVDFWQRLCVAEPDA